MIYTNNSPISTRLSQEEKSLLLHDKEAKNDKLLLPSSTRSLKRRSSLFEKSRDWARRLMTIHRPRRNTISNEKIRELCYELNQKHEINNDSSHKFLYNYEKNFDEDGYLSPMEIQTEINNNTQENINLHQSYSKLSINSDQLLINSSSNSNVSQVIYRYQDPNIQSTLSKCTCPQIKRLPTTSFVSEFQKSLSIVDYIDFDVSDDLSKYDDNDNDELLESLKYLFNDNYKQKHQQKNISRRIPRRSTNASSISTDSGYSDIPNLSTKIVPVHLISCTIVPVNVTTIDPTNIHYLTCTCRSPSSSSSSLITCLSNKQERKLSSHASRSNIFHQPLLNVDKTENGINNQCICNNKYYSTMTIYPSTKSITKINDHNEEYYYKQPQKRNIKTKRTSLVRLPSITDDLISISRWYKPYLEREAVCDVLQQADYGAFVLRNSTTHPDCYALSIKVPKFTHDSNIVHYLIEKLTNNNNNPSYRIKGTIKQFPTLLSLLTHHSVMPEILPIILNLNESFTI